MPGAAGRNAPGSVANSLSDELVGNGERVVEDLDRFVELLPCDRERRAAHDDVPVRHQVEAAIERALHHCADRLRVVAAAVERHERLARVSVLDELDAPEAAETTHLADRRIL